MSIFVTYSSENAEYYLKPAGYAALIILMLAALALTMVFWKSQKSKQAEQKSSMDVKQLTFSALAMALAMVTSYIKFASLPFGGSITLFSMFFICFIGYLYGVKVGVTTGVAYGLLQLVTGPYIYHPIQVLLDYPLAFGALGLAGIFCNSKGGLIKGVLVGVAGRYICHVISGYVFFAEYADGNPVLYTLSYNATYILPELIATIILLCIPPVAAGLKQVKKMALN